MIAAREELVDRARDSTGLSDLGADGWQEGLDRLVDAARTDVDLDDDSARRFEATAIGRLVNRLRIEDWYAQQSSPPPEIDGLVVIHGLPRTGTTALENLLALGPTFRYQRRWEISDPVPPPDAATEAEDPRRLRALGAGDATGAFSVQHISSVDGAVDDGTILGLDFHNQELGLPVPTYTRWWRSADCSSTYAYHERILRLLHVRRGPRRWLVKAPYHNFHIDDLAAQYPNARFVMTHRDPALAFPSTCSVVATTRRGMLPGEPFDPVALGAFLLEHLVDGAGRAMAARAAIGEDRFLDVHQLELQDDAVGTAERVYDFLGIPLDDTLRATMEEWAVANARGSRGEHAYSPEEYGLTADEIRSAFSAYMQRYDVQPEAE